MGRHQPCAEERIEVLSDTIERHHSSRNTPSLFYPESFGWKLEKSYATSASSTDFLETWMKELGSEVARQPEGEVARQAKSSQSIQPNPNPDHDRTVKYVVCPQRGAPRSQEIETRSFREEAMKHDRTVKPVVCPQEGALQTRFSRDSTNFNVEDETNHDRTVKLVVCRDANHERSMLNEVDIDLRIPGLPHSVVKQVDTYRVRELLKKIENHPRRQSLQRDLQQNNSYNPFCKKSPRT